MSAETLRLSLERLGLRGDVEARERLAVLVTADAETARRLADPDVRRSVVSLAGEHGFTHVALELSDAGAGAPLHRG